MVWTGVPPILIIHIWRHITTFIHFTSFHPVKAYIANPPILDTGMMKSGAPSGVNHWFPAERYMLCDGRVWNRLQKLQVWKAGYALGMHWVCSFIILASFIGKLQDRFKTLMQIQGALSPMGAGVQNAMACIHIPLQSVCPWPVQLGMKLCLVYVGSSLLAGCFFLVSVCFTALHVAYTCTLFKSCFYLCSVRSVPVPQCYHLCELSWHSILLSTRAMPLAMSCEGHVAVRLAMKNSAFPSAVEPTPHKADKGVWRESTVNYLLIGSANILHVTWIRPKSCWVLGDEFLLSL